MSDPTKRPRPARGGKKSPSRIRHIFNQAAYGACLGGLALLAWDATPVGRYIRLYADIGPQAHNVCITYADLNPILRGGQTPPTVAQAGLQTLVMRMDDSAIGKTLNTMLQKTDVLLCMRDSDNHYGAYDGRDRVIYIAANTYGGADKILEHPVLQNAALRTMYEEAAHAHQDLYGPGLGIGTRVERAQNIAFVLALESAARVTAFTALYQHYLAGETALWIHNQRLGKDNPMMGVMYRHWQNAPNISPENNHEALRAGFAAFFENRPLVNAYVNTARQSLPDPDPAQARDLSMDKITKTTRLPAQDHNYMAGTNYSPRDAYWQGTAPRPPAAPRNEIIAQYALPAAPRVL